MEALPPEPASLPWDAPRLVPPKRPLVPEFAGVATLEAPPRFAVFCWFAELFILVVGGGEVETSAEVDSKSCEWFAR